MRIASFICLTLLALAAPGADEAKIATINLERIKDAVGTETLAIYFMDEDAMADYKALVKKREELVQKKKEAGLRESDRLADEIKRADKQMEEMREESGLSTKKLNRALVRYLKKSYGTDYVAILDTKVNEEGMIVHSSAKVEDITDKAIEKLKAK